MSGIKSLLWIGGVLLSAFSLTTNAEPLHPDPAWQQGQLGNGFSWQVLTTPQRPADRIQLRLVVNTGSLNESAQQRGFSHVLARLAMVHNSALTPQQQRTLWHEDMSASGVLPPVITSYEVTQYNLSLPVNRPELMKSALDWLAATAGDMHVTPEIVSSALHASDPTATWPENSKDALWQYRLQGSALLDHDPSIQPSTLRDTQGLAQFYHQWYTPDAMTLYVIGNVDNRAIVEQVGRAFSTLKGRRTVPTPVPRVQPLPKQAMALTDDTHHQPRLILNWDREWVRINDSQSLEHYWLSDLARETIYWHLHTAGDTKEMLSQQVGLQCQLLYSRAQCGLTLDAPGDTLAKQLDIVAKELVNLRDEGLSDTEFTQVLARKNSELAGLFATYARTPTDVLMAQRLRSQQNGMVDIAPEQYQKLRQAFLANLTREQLNHELHQQLSQAASLVLLQSAGESKVNIDELQDQYNNVMKPTEVQSDTSTGGSHDQ